MSWHRCFYTCRKCGTVLMDVSEHWLGKQITNHLLMCREVLNTHVLSEYTEVKDRMKIPQSVLESGATKSGLQFIKAGQIGAQLGQTINFTIAGDVEVSGTDNPLYSVPVKSDFKGGLQGQYSLNKTALKILARQLGDETTAWIGARYTSFVGPARNPRTNEQTLGFTILADSVKSAKTK